MKIAFLAGVFGASVLVGAGCRDHTETILVDAASEAKPDVAADAPAQSSNGGGGGVAGGGGAGGGGGKVAADAGVGDAGAGGAGGH